MAKYTEIIKFLMYKRLIYSLLISNFIFGILNNLI